MYHNTHATALDNEFTDGNPLENIGRSILVAAWLNMIQREGLALVNGAGLAPDENAFNQWLKAALKIAGQSEPITLAVNTSLTSSHRGVINIDASAGDVVLTLPAATAAFGFLFRRIDNTSNKAVVQCDGSDKILHNTHISSSGYALIRLFGRGDFWELRSNHANGWLPVNRLDPRPIGEVAIQSGTLLPSGGYLKLNGEVGTILRADYPWLWDYAGVSGNLDTDANWSTGKKGGFSSGNGTTTMRVLELRGEFIRVYDDGRGIDTDAVLGQRELSQNQQHGHHLFVDVADSSDYVNNTTHPFATDAGAVGTGLQYQIHGATTGPATLGLTSSSGGDEARPRNVPLPHLLKII